MSAFEILCVTMAQTDFSKIQQMNIHSDVVFANQSNRTAFEETIFEGRKARNLLHHRRRCQSLFKAIKDKGTLFHDSQKPAY